MKLYDYLSQDKHLAFYLGIDQHWPFLKRAKKRIGSAQCRFRLADISRTPLPELDIIIASGSLNYQSRQIDYLKAYDCPYVRSGQRSRHLQLAQ